MADLKNDQTDNMSKENKGVDLKNAAQIEWYYWNADPFNIAEAKQKMIVLKISASWCHWCRKLEEEVLSDPLVCEYIAENFVPISVDVDKNPEVAERYVQEGGYPTICFLTPEGEIIYGTNYMPLPQFREVMEEIGQYFRDNKQKINYDIELLKKEYQTMIPFDDSAKLPEDHYKSVLDGLTSNFDAVFGGFGEQTKFPYTDVIEFLLQDHERTGSKKSLEMATKTLDGIASGLYDEEDGGFFRYSVTEDWKTPHYEKLLEDNCNIINCYVHAHLIEPNEQYKKVILGSLEFLKRVLWNDETGTFGSSISTDEAYYKAEPAERKKMPKPAIDRTIITNKNAIASSTLLKAAALFDDPAWETMARRILDFLIKNCYSKRRGFAHYFDGEPKNQGLLLDLVAGEAALLNAYEYFGDHKYFELAEMINTYTLGNLTSPAKGGFIDFQQWDESLGRLYFVNKPFVENSQMINLLMKFYEITGTESYKVAAERVITQFADIFLSYGYVFAATFALAVNSLRDPVLVRAVKGVDHHSSSILKKLFLISDSRKAIKLVDRASENDLVESLTKNKKVDSEFIVISKQERCSKPIIDTENLNAKYFAFVKNKK